MTEVYNTVELGTTLPVASFVHSGLHPLQGEDQLRYPQLGCTPKGVVGATQRSQKVLRRFWDGSGEGFSEGSEKGGLLWFFTVKKGSEKGVSRRCLERPFGEYALLGRCALPKIPALFPTGTAAQVGVLNYKWGG